MVRQDHDGALHCCQMSTSRPVVLACDAQPGDLITSVPFAFLGESPLDGGWCGNEITAECGQAMEAELEAQCVGRSRCIVDTVLLGDPCPTAQDLILSLRWTCRADMAGWSPGSPAVLQRLPLRAEGGVIVDRHGDRLRLIGVNWAGGHNHHFAPAGLDKAPLRSLARLVRQLGFNLVRVTFSSETFGKNPSVSARAVAANPVLYGLQAVEVLDRVVEALAAEGLLVWLDGHMLEADWCCDVRDCNGLWFNNRHTEDEWVEMWAKVARRYKTQHAVIGVGLKNEPRPVCEGPSWGVGERCNLTAFKDAGAVPDSVGCIEPGWAFGPPRLRWREAAERAGAAVLRENPKLLVSVSGLQFSTNLTEALDFPARLPQNNLIYEAHEYHWFHKRWTLQDFGPYARKLDRMWGNLLSNDIAPVIVSEFGMPHQWKDSVGLSVIDQWLRLFERYARDGPLGHRGGLDMMYWQLAGVDVGGTSRDEGSVESFGILNECWSGPAGGRHFAALRRIMDLPAAPTMVIHTAGLDHLSEEGGFTWTFASALLGTVVAVGLVCSACFTAQMRRRASNPRARTPHHCISFGRVESMPQPLETQYAPPPVQSPALGVAI